jgi:hypothetical protein
MVIVRVVLHSSSAPEKTIMVTVIVMLMVPVRLQVVCMILCRGNLKIALGWELFYHSAKHS